MKKIAPYLGGLAALATLYVFWKRSQAPTPSTRADVTSSGTTPNFAGAGSLTDTATKTADAQIAAATDFMSQIKLHPGLGPLLGLTQQSIDRIILNPAQYAAAYRPALQGTTVITES